MRGKIFTKNMCPYVWSVCQIPCLSNTRVTVYHQYKLWLLATSKSAVILGFLSNTSKSAKVLELLFTTSNRSTKPTVKFPQQYNLCYNKHHLKCSNTRVTVHHLGMKKAVSVIYWWFFTAALLQLLLHSCSYAALTDALNIRPLTALL